MQGRSEPSDLPSYTQAVADGASPPRPLPEPVGPPAYLTSDSERWEKYTSPSTSTSSFSQTTHDPSTTNGRFVEGYGVQYDSQGDQRPLPQLVLAPLRRNETDDTFSDEVVQSPNEFTISSSSVTPSQSPHENTCSYRSSSTTLIGTATSIFSSFLATVSGKDSEPVDEESQLPRPLVDPHLTLEDLYPYPSSSRYHQSISNAASCTNQPPPFSLSSWTDTGQSESVEMTAASDQPWPGIRSQMAYWEHTDEYDAVEVPPSVYVWMGKGKEEVW